MFMNQTLEIIIVFCYFHTTFAPKQKKCFILEINASTTRTRIFVLNRNFSKFKHGFFRIKIKENGQKTVHLDIVTGKHNRTKRAKLTFRTSCLQYETRKYKKNGGGQNIRAC